ncbi:MAG: DUF3040 domain-containing protein [Bowdeniella nasicola]|nr:DUF3040 domain-containing protein [Bowdeniella nasicola]
MALSEYERRVLAEMEEHLRADDPKLAQSLRSNRSLDIRRVSLGILGLILGLTGLVGGVATGHIWLGILSFVVMLVGVLWALGTPVAKSKPAKPQQKASSTFMQRQEDRWDNRRR